MRMRMLLALIVDMRRLVLGDRDKSEIAMHHAAFGEQRIRI